MPSEKAPEERRPSAIRAFTTIVGVVFAAVWIAGAVSMRAPIGFILGGAAVIVLAVWALHRIRRR